MKKVTPSANSIDALESDYLYVNTSQLPNSGQGLFTAIDIFEDEIIAVFEGELLSEQESKCRALVGQDKYFIMLLDGRIMDSMHTDCWAKFANDAKGTIPALTKNNASISVDDSGRPCLIASHTIKAGQEIFCGYGKKYWERHHH